MKQNRKLLRGLPLLLCALCLASACAVPIFAADASEPYAEVSSSVTPTSTLSPTPSTVTVKCTTPVITYKYFGKFQVAVLIYYDPANTNCLTVNVNGRPEIKSVASGSSPLILEYYLQQNTNILVTAAASYDDPSVSAPTPSPSPTSPVIVYEASDLAAISINGYAVPNTSLKVNASVQGVNKFSDVPADAWYKTDVNRLVKAGAIKGVSATAFAPDDPMTSAQYLKLLMASMYNDEMINQFYSGSAWYDPYYEFSALSVNEDGFLDAVNADRDISRYEMAVLLARAYKLYVPNNVYQQAVTYADPGAIADYESIPEQYREAVLVCYYTNMLRGMDDAGSFCGDSVLTRCQACSSVTRLFDAI